MTVRAKVETIHPTDELGAKRNFILQQGLTEPISATCAVQYSALHFQPRLIGLYLIVAAILQSPLMFFALAVVLWGSALLPRLNPFDALYNWTFARSTGITLTSAPGPRRFAQFLAGSFALTIGVLLVLGWRTTAFVVEGIFILAVAALVFGSFCLGSFVFHVVRGRISFAKRTLPWATKQ